ncbi:hypothetical protein Tco_0200488, partial [Tanacetum coccineum]
VHGAPISKEDINQKFLRSLPSSWNQIALIMRIKPDIDEIDIDNLYNNLRVYEDELKRQDLGFIPSGNVVLSSTYVGKILGADQLLVILCYRYQESGIGYWILSMTISGSGLRMTKVIKGEFGKLEDLNNKDVLLTCDTSLEVLNKEFNRMSGIDDDLFTYEVEVANC